MKCGRCLIFLCLLLLFDTLQSFCLRKASSSLIGTGIAATVMSSSASEHSAPPVVWTIAGSDSGGGAGIQADLIAMHALGCHGCSVITALTAQNSHEVRGIETPSVSILRKTLGALYDDLPPRSVKLGMLATVEVVKEVSAFVKKHHTSLGPIICDPVMVSTSGSILLDEEARTLIITELFPKATLVTPNKQETEMLVGFSVNSSEDMERAARAIISLGKCRAVLVKGGHSADEEVAQDYLFDSQAAEEAQKGMWITSPRIANSNTHGTGCTLSSAIAAFLAGGLALGDAVVMAKAYVTQGIRGAVRMGRGPGPVRQTAWPDSAADFPWVTNKAEEGCSGQARLPPFPRCHERHLGLYACVHSFEWVERLLALGVKQIQLRMKDESPEVMEEEIRKSVMACNQHQARLWVNDHWELAIRQGAYGLHIGQEDLMDLLSTKAKDKPSPLEQIQRANIRLGISTHSYEELARAVALQPSYISLGPIFPTTSKTVDFAAQGLSRIRIWRQLVGPEIPLVVIGGITLETAKECLAAGAQGLCVISALTKAPDLVQAVTAWQRQLCRESG